VDPVRGVDAGHDGHSAQPRGQSDTIDGWRGSGRLSFALDTWWRFCRMYAVTVLEVPQELLPAEPAAHAGEGERRAAIEGLRALCAGRGTPIPDDPRVQLRQAVEAVFRSSRSPRARVYREREGIRDEVDTAVIVQAMVFGNLGADSGTGVAFSRNPSTGDPQPYGEFLINAQGEDVVAGVRASLPLGDMRLALPDAHARLLVVLRRLERHYRDLCDVEFTVQRGSLYVLQVRIGKRSAEAAARIAVDLAQDPEIGLSRGEALARLSAEQIRQLQNQAEVAAGAAVLARGVAAAPGVGCGRVCTDPDRAAQWSARGDPVILVRPTTAPHDVHGMVGSAGVVTATGGWSVMPHWWPEAGAFRPCAACRNCVRAAAVDRWRGIEEGEWLTIDGTRGTLHRGRCAMAGRTLPYLAELNEGGATDCRSANRHSRRMLRPAGTILSRRRAAVRQARSARSARRPRSFQRGRSGVRAAAGALLVRGGRAGAARRVACAATRRAGGRSGRLARHDGAADATRTATDAGGRHGRCVAGRGTARAPMPWRRGCLPALHGPRCRVQGAGHALAAQDHRRREQPNDHADADHDAAVPPPGRPARRRATWWPR
jgi:pyruvate,orthophosphate dikinase